MKKKKSPYLFLAGMFLIGLIMGGLVTARVMRDDTPALVDQGDPIKDDDAPKLAANSDGNGSVLEIEPGDGLISGEARSLSGGAPDPTPQSIDGVLEGGGAPIMMRQSADEVAGTPSNQSDEVTELAKLAKASRDIGEALVSAAPELSGDTVDEGLVPSADSRPMLAIVLDDCGYNLQVAKRVKSFNLTMTWAVIPGLRHSAEIADMLDRDGIPYLVHIPMQAIGDPDGRAGHAGLNGDYAVGVGMEKQEIRRAIEPLMDSLPNAYGISNHRGSKATSDRRTMDALMDILKERGLFFLDSHTSSSTVAYKMAVDRGVPAAINSYFIDGAADVSGIAARMKSIIASVSKRGSGVAICHLRSGTIEFLEEFAKHGLSGAEVRLVTLPQLVMERSGSSE